MMRKLGPTVLMGLVLFAGALLTGAWTEDEKAPPAATLVDTKDCATCHQAAVGGMKHTIHATLEKGCVSCHEAGASAEHMKSQMEGGSVRGPAIEKLSADKVDQTCLTCHDKGRQANHAGGVHSRRNVSCASCHSVHASRSTKALLKTARDSETCFTCHQTIRGKNMRASHHPVREGRMECASCHDAHDSTSPKMVSAAYVNEKCLECHTEKRGPFLWEHAPVRENCLNCHDPHGSHHEKLLVAKQPFLCQRCHLNTRHPGTLYDGRQTIVGASLPTVSNRAVERSCKNCHQSVHGGNAPSGPYFGR
jgi:DmsE family decaheme c-type cytochrome